MKEYELKQLRSNLRELKASAKRIRRLRNKLDGFVYPAENTIISAIRTKEVRNQHFVTFTKFNGG